MDITIGMVLKTLKGEPIKDKDADATKDLTLGGLMVNALSMGAPDDKADGPEKLKRYRLANRIFEAKDTVALKAEEIVLVKNLIAKIYASPIIVGQAWVLLDPQ